VNTGVDHSRSHLLTAREAAQYLRISLNTLYRMEQKGHIDPFRTPGGHRRYSYEMLEHYLEQSRSGSNAAGGAK
jgi:excisionase family DNA binding protein